MATPRVASTGEPHPDTDDPTSAIVHALYTDGISGAKGALSVEWADDLRKDIDAALDEALSRKDEAVGRGPSR